jgi:hypothetical protein
MHLRHTRASERGLHSNRIPIDARGRRWRTALVLQIPAASSPCAGACTRGRRDWPLSAAPSESSRPCFTLDTESSVSPAERLQAAIVALAGAGGTGWRGGRHETEAQAAGCKPAGKLHGETRAGDGRGARSVTVLHEIKVQVPDPLFEKP